MRILPNWFMELGIVVALGVAVVAVIIALQDPPGDRTRFTLERTEAPRMIGQSPPLPIAEEPAPGR